MQGFENNKDYIVIKKETVIDWFFISVFILGCILFVILMGRSIYYMANPYSGGLNGDLISYYHDDFLGLTLPIPGGNWQIAEIDTEDIERVVAESAGEDEYFDFDTDPLKEEVLSLACFNQEGTEGYRQFMSFTFKPSPEFVSEDEYIEYCQESFKHDIENSGDFDSFEIISVAMDSYKGVLMKMKCVDTVEEELALGGVRTFDDVLYYTQYIRDYGVNMGTVTFGSIMEDNTVDIYLKYFLNNMILDSLQEMVY